jgi:serine/threonine protein kinase
MGADDRIAEGVEVVPGYDLVSKLGQGGFGAVWKANGPGNIAVALKLIELGGSESGLKEFKSLDLLRELRHPNLVPVHAYWLVDEDGNLVEDNTQAELLVIAMLLAEKSLRERLKESRKQGLPGIAPKELLGYMHDAARGLDFLNSPTHQLGDQMVSIQHRDIKPENLLVVGGGAMVADFGIAKVMSSGNSSSYTEHVSLTLAYGAPELFEGRATNRTDQYSLALTYYELLTSSLPFESDVTPATVMRVHMGGHHNFSRVSEAEQAVLRKATAPASEDRFESCIEMVDALMSVQGVGGVTQIGSAAPGGPLAKTGEFTDAQFMATQVSQGDLTQSNLDRTAQLTQETQGGAGRTQVGFPTVGGAAVPAAPRAKNRLGLIAMVGLLLIAAAGGGWWLATQQDPTTTSGGDPPRVPLVPEEDPKEKKGEEGGVGGSAEVASGKGEDTGESDPKMKQQAPEPSLRERAALALAGKQYQDAKDFLDEMIAAGAATSEDYALRASAFIGLAEDDDLAGDDLARAKNFEQAAADYRYSEHQDEAANASFAAFQAYAKQADKEFAATSNDSEQVQALDTKANDQLRASIELAKVLELNTLPTWEAEFTKRQQLPRAIQRARMATAAQELPKLLEQLQGDLENPQLLLRVAKLEEALGKTEEANAHFVHGHSLIAIQLARQSKVEEAQQTLQEALKYDPDRRAMLTNFAAGVVLLQQEQNSGALRALTAAIELADKSEPRRWEMFRDRAEANGRLGHTSEAVRDLQAAIDGYTTAVTPPGGNPVSTDQAQVASLYAMKARFLEQQLDDTPEPDELKVVAEAYDQATKLNPPFLSYQLGLARTFVRWAESDPDSSDQTTIITRASEAITKVLAQDRSLAEVHNLEGRVNLMQDRIASAQQAFDRAVANVDQDRDAENLYRFYSDQAQTYLLDPRDNQKALAAADKAVAVNGQQILGLYCRAFALRNLKRVSDAVKAFDAVLKIDPDHPDSLLYKSQFVLEATASTKSQIAAARADIDRALKLATTDTLKAEAHYVLSLAWIKEYLANRTNAAVGEPALFKCEQSILTAMKLAPGNSVYRTEGKKVFDFVKGFDWEDAKLRQESDKLIAEYNAVRGI